MPGQRFVVEFGLEVLSSLHVDQENDTNDVVASHRMRYFLQAVVGYLAEER